MPFDSARHVIQKELKNTQIVFAGSSSWIMAGVEQSVRFGSHGENVAADIFRSAGFLRCGDHLLHRFFDHPSRY